MPVSPSASYLANAATTSPAVTAQLMKAPFTPIPAVPVTANAAVRDRSKIWRWIGLAAAIGLTARLAYSLFLHLRSERRRLRLVNRLETLGASGLKNSYFMVRHGESTANVAGIVSSDPAVATVTHGLTEAGRKQVAEAAAEWHKQLPLHQPIIILSSDFLRAKETAEVVKETLLRHRLRVGLASTDAFNSVVLEPQLRERSFGRHEGQANTAYDLVWTADALSADHEEAGVESVNDVVRRATQLILDTEWQLKRIGEGAFHRSAASHAAADFSTLPSASSLSSSSSSSSHPACSVILVAHGDVCQILASAFRGMDSRLHRSLPHWRNGEMRQLKWKPSEQSRLK